MSLVSLFVPLVMGLYWKRATTQGAILSTTLGVVCWATVLLAPLLGDGYFLKGIDEVIPPQFAGLFAALTGMLVGSLGPQLISNQNQLAQA